MDARIVRSTRYICTVVFVSPVDSLFFAPLRRVLQVSSVPHSDPYPKVTYQVVSPVPRATIAGVRVHHSYTVPGTSVSSVRLPYPYPKSTNPALRQNMTFFFTCRALDSGGQTLQTRTHHGLDHRDPFHRYETLCIRSRSYRSHHLKHVRIMQIIQIPPDNHVQIIQVPPRETCADQEGVMVRPRKADNYLRNR